MLTQSNPMTAFFDALFNYLTSPTSMNMDKLMLAMTEADSQSGRSWSVGISDFKNRIIPILPKLLDKDEGAWARFLAPFKDYLLFSKFKRISPFADKYFSVVKFDSHYAPERKEVTIRGDLMSTLESLQAAQPGELRQQFVLVSDRLSLVNGRVLAIE